MKENNKETTNVNASESNISEDAADNGKKTVSKRKKRCIVWGSIVLAVIGVVLVLYNRLCVKRWE